MRSIPILLIAIIIALVSNAQITESTNEDQSSQKASQNEQPKITSEVVQAKRVVTITPETNENTTRDLHEIKQIQEEQKEANRKTEGTVNRVTWQDAKQSQPATIEEKKQSKGNPH